jgi:hypothetical protein
LKSMAEYTTKNRGMSPGLTISHSHNGELERETINERPTAGIGAKRELAKDHQECLRTGSQLRWEARAPK